MKRLLLIGLALIAVFTLKAQKSNLIFFSEHGERFSLIMNGIIQNSVPKSNILVTNLTAYEYEIKIVFEDKTIDDINKLLPLNQGTEATFMIKQNDGAYYSLCFLRDVRIEDAPKPNSNQTVIVYHNK